MRRHQVPAQNTGEGLIKRNRFAAHGVNEAQERILSLFQVHFRLQSLKLPPCPALKAL